MKEKNYSRKEFLSKCVHTGSILLGSLTLLDSCDDKKPASADKKESASKNVCEDFSSVSKAEMEKRAKFGYVDKSQVEGSFCGNCALFVPYKENQGCGDCLLFKGPVRQAGYCIQYAAKQV